MALIRSKRTGKFKDLFTCLPGDIQALARDKYKLWLENPNHPSLRFKPIRSARDNPFPMYEISITLSYRAVCFKDKDTYVWEWVGTHEKFNKLY